MTRYEPYYKKNATASRDTSRKSTATAIHETKDLFTHTEVHKLLKARHGTEIADEMMGVRSVEQFRTFCSKRGM